VKTPKSPKGDIEEFIDFQRIPLQGSGVKELKINELLLFGVGSLLYPIRRSKDFTQALKVYDLIGFVIN